jgi:hypothetical protein
MTTMLNRPEVTGTKDVTRRGLLMMPELWGTVAIVAMWMAVLFDGIYGADFTSWNAGSQATTIPSAVFLALFACIGTVSVAKRVFGREQK